MRSLVGGAPAYDLRCGELTMVHIFNTLVRIALILPVQ
jgi:hypothetical protein